MKFIAIFCIVSCSHCVFVRRACVKQHAVACEDYVTLFYICSMVYILSNFQFYLLFSLGLYIDKTFFHCYIGINI